MKRNESEQSESERLVCGQELLRKRAIFPNQRWQLSDEEEVHVITMSVRLQNSQNWLRQEEGVEGVFACHRRDSHCLGHVARPIRIFGKVTPYQAKQCHDPDSQTDRSMKLQKSCVGGTRRGEIGGERRSKYEPHETGSQPVHQSRSMIEISSI